MNIDEVKIVLKEIKGKQKHIMYLNDEVIDTIIAELDNKDKQLEKIREYSNARDSEFMYCVEEKIKLKEECVSKDKVIEAMANKINCGELGLGSNCICYGLNNRKCVIEHFENLAKGSE